LPELPLMPDVIPRFCKIDELLQLYAIVILDVFVIRNVVVVSNTIPLINNNLLICC
jgi:hypothetical protein